MNKAKQISKTALVLATTLLVTVGCKNKVILMGDKIEKEYKVAKAEAIAHDLLYSERSAVIDKHIDAIIARCGDRSISLKNREPSRTTRGDYYLCRNKFLKDYDQSVTQVEERLNVFSKNAEKMTAKQLDGAIELMRHQINAL